MTFFEKYFDSIAVTGHWQKDNPIHWHLRGKGLDASDTCMTNWML